MKPLDHHASGVIRLGASTETPGALPAHGQLIKTLARSEMFQDYEQAYTEATGMPIALRAMDSWQLPFRGQRKENAFCAQMAEQSHTCAVCLQFQEQLAQDARHEPATRTCAYGLCETAVPVKLGSQTVGFLQTGQVLRGQPTEASFQRAVEQARKLGVDISNARTKRAYFATPVASPKKLDSATHLLAIFADHLAMKSNQLVMQTEHPEPQIIARAKQFIREHYMEALSLGRVSSASNMSTFYFCKLFRKFTTVTFTQFVSRTRIEQAKHLLPNPNLRVSEIGYAVGFQSLSHFNRMFKQIAGESPTDFRDQLQRPGAMKPERDGMTVKSAGRSRQSRSENSRRAAGRPPQPASRTPALPRVAPASSGRVPGASVLREPKPNSQPDANGKMENPARHLIPLLSAPDNLKVALPRIRAVRGVGVHALACSVRPAESNA